MTALVVLDDSSEGAKRKAGADGEMEQFKDEEVRAVQQEQDFYIVHKGLPLTTQTN